MMNGHYLENGFNLKYNSILIYLITGYTEHRPMAASALDKMIASLLKIKGMKII